MTDPRAEIQKVEEDIRRLEELKQSGALPPDLADVSIEGLQIKRATYWAELRGDGAIAQGDHATAIGQQGIGVGGSVSGDILGAGATKLEQHFYSDKNAKSLPLSEALQHYLDNIIATHQHLRLQGIRAGSQPLSVLLEKVYVSLTIMDKRAGGARTDLHSDGGTLTIGAALQNYQRLVIIGDPGSGKTTLLSYLALTYARTLRDHVDHIKARLGFSESGNLPILLPLRDLGRHLLEKHPNPGKDGPALLLDYLLEHYQSQAIDLPAGFFGAYLEKGTATLLLDGMDEVADPALRQRVARLIEKFSERYPRGRFIVTSREVGYEGAAKIGAQFGLARVRDFSPSEVRQFVRDWTRVVEITLAQSDAPEVLRLADAQAEKLIHAIDTNPRVADLAVNPLLLTVIALVHRYRAQLPERRSELYEEVVEVLLGHWDEAKGLDREAEVAGLKMDSGDRRSLLEPVAFWMHAQNQREIERDDLRAILLPAFKSMAGTDAQAGKALDDFLLVVNERSGLLIERGMGMYGFAHLTFQEYLAARALADRKDALDFTLKHLPEAWWREVILLQVGYLSTQGKRRVSELIALLMNADPKTEPEPHHHLLLAAECLFDVGAARVEGDLLGEARKRLKKQADAHFKKDDKASVLAKITASNALARLESGQVVAHFWKPPHGEPEWVTIPAGEFWMGDDNSQEADERPGHKLHLPEFQIARVPVTNAQYALYVQDSKVKPPEHWRGGDVPPGLENHPVVNVTWHEALAYCKWLGEKIQKPVTLPSEAEWEKAARGSSPRLLGEGQEAEFRNYPWGADWRELHCNSAELGLGDTTPVGLFLNGASPYGVLDMSGNVWEWTHSIYKKYPYTFADGREELQSKDSRSLRGGSFYYVSNLARGACRSRNDPDFRHRRYGFRVVVSPVLPS
jgi:formylglycine-generating enzyme required for sulfatase activity